MKTLLALLLIVSFSAQAGTCLEAYKSNTTAKQNGYFAAGGAGLTILGAAAIPGLLPFAIFTTVGTGGIFIVKSIDYKAKIKLLTQAHACEGKKITKFYEAYREYNPASEMSMKEVCDIIVAHDNSGALCQADTWADEFTKDQARLVIKLNDKNGRKNGCNILVNQSITKNQTMRDDYFLNLDKKLVKRGYNLVTDAALADYSLDLTVGKPANYWRAQGVLTDLDSKQKETFKEVSPGIFLTRIFNTDDHKAEKILTSRIIKQLPSCKSI
jgi:hypothetical protein